MIGGVQPFTLSDYPGKPATIIFTKGCNYRCPYCYNPDLVLPEKIAGLPSIGEYEVLDYLIRRKRFVEAVVITGGEPTIHGKRLVDFVFELKKNGFYVKLDTNGSKPEILSEIIQYLDYVSLDFKTDEKRYPVVGGSVEHVLDSLSILRRSGKDYEIRVVLFPSLVDLEFFVFLSSIVKSGEKVVLKRFINSYNLIDEACRYITPYSLEEEKSFIALLKDASVFLM